MDSHLPGPSCCHTTEDEIQALVTAFQTCSLARNLWTHRAHLIVGFWYVWHDGRDEALNCLRSGIRRLNESHDVVNSDHAGYHESITRFYVWVIATFLAQDDCPSEFLAAVNAFLDSPYTDRQLPLRYYSRERITSVKARHEWVEPDLARLVELPPDGSQVAGSGRGQQVSFRLSSFGP